MAEFIKKIKASNDVEYELDAKKWDGHFFSDVESMIHGVVDTYVIPTTVSSANGYSGVVGATTAQVSTTVSVLNTLTSSSTTNTYKVGDIILMGATSDGIKNFDRWVSKVSGSGTTATVYLDVLETKVAKHHHTITVPSVSSSTTTVLTSAKVGSTTTSNMAYAGTAKTVVTGVSNANDVVITSVTQDSTAGSYDLNIETGASTDYGHTHTITAHNHTVSYDKTTVSAYVSAYTSLSTDSYTPHTHTLVSVAGEAKSDGTITYVNSTPKSTATFIKSLTDASTTTNTGAATPGTSAVALTTSTQASTDTIGDVVKTTSSGAHTHTVTTTTDNNVVTAATVAASVVISAVLSYTAPTVAEKVVTSVGYDHASTVTSWVATVTSGVLSFDVPTGSRVTAVTATSVTQSAGSASLNAPRSAQSRTLGKATSTGSAASAGAHQHGFSHTHAIAEHSHSVNSHTHTYKKQVAGTTESAITALSTSTYNAHKHTNISVVGTTTDSTPITYVTGGTKSSAVGSLKISSTSATVGNTTPTISTVYQKITGTITHPALSIGSKKLADMLATGTVTPAVDSKQKPAMSVSTSSKSVVESVTVGTSSVKTSTNIGGE